MKVTINANGKTVQVEMTEEQLKELGVIKERSRTGYERVKNNEIYYLVDIYDNIMRITEYNDQDDKQSYDTGNYYSDRNIAENNARADRLQRCLRQWQAQNDKPISMSDWKNDNISKYYVDYDCFHELFFVTYAVRRRSLNNIYFTSKEKAKEAAGVFKDELLWYFTEYVQRLDEMQND